jgi:hypothetical protein
MWKTRNAYRILARIPLANFFKTEEEIGGKQLR